MNPRITWRKTPESSLTIQTQLISSINILPLSTTKTKFTTKGSAYCGLQQSSVILIFLKLLFLLLDFRNNPVISYCIQRHLSPPVLWQTLLHVENVSLFLLSVLLQTDADSDCGWLLVSRATAEFSCTETALILFPDSTIVMVMLTNYVVHKNQAFPVLI